MLLYSLADRKARHNILHPDQKSIIFIERRMAIVNFKVTASPKKLLPIRSLHLYPCRHMGVVMLQKYGQSLHTFKHIANQINSFIYIKIAMNAYRLYNTLFETFPRWR